MANEIRRTGDVRIKLSPEMLARLEAMATAYGMPSATFAAFAIADYINRQDNQAKLGRMATLETVRRLGFDDSDKLEAMIESTIEAMAPQIAKALAQENLPLDHEARGAQ